MKATKVVQPTLNPTNKLSAATIAAAIMAVSGMVVKNLWPEWYSAEVWMTLMPIVGVLAGYFVKDNANVIVLTEDEYRER